VGLDERLRQGLARTLERFQRRAANVSCAHATTNEAFYEELEAALLTPDVGVAKTG
jgi:signal recognition particle GTPase